MSRFTEITSSVSKSYLKTGSWNAFGSSFSDTSFDGIKLQTGSLNFYLRYRTCNKTYGWYPYVTSKVNDYAGSSGKSVEAVQIQVYNNSDTKIDKGFIVMYRAYVSNNWLGWVSNASPERMQMIYNQFGFDGALDLTGSNSGLPGNGIPLSQFEIRIFEEDLSVDPGDIPTSEINGVSQSYMVNGVWNALTSSVSSAMHGVRIQTTGKPYYLKYRTYNTGHGWYPYVLSNDTSSEAYAGSFGKAIEGIQIQVYDNAGAKLSKTFVVMYRVFADGNWLDWVSNAPYDIMQSLQADANLGGSLDGNSSNAGYPGTGKAITQVDIRVFEYVKEPSNNYPAATGEFSQIYHSGGTWYELTANTHVSSMDGVKLTTSSSHFSIKYRTYSTETGWLPYVTSISTDYAGSFGKAIEALQIEVYDSSNVKLDNTYVVMYRAYANGKWLDWVSNASPEKMSELLERGKLDGKLDTAGAYAGIKGTPINKLQIQFYPKEPVVLPSETTIEKPIMSYMVGSSTSWRTFEDSVTVSQMDGIKIQTSTDKSYYLQYRTFNAGKTDWYPYVKSTINDYAGSAGKAIQRFQIQAYKNDGTKLSSGVIVMYRAYVNGAWLNWVSNANKACMEYVQNKYNLGGNLDTAGSYAGISGKNIEGIEIRVYVDNTIATAPTTPTGNYKIIQAPFLSQLGSYPTGCESVSAVMALNYAGVNITVNNFIDSYLEMSNMPFDPYLSFGGNPRSTTGYGCYAPVIKKAMNKALSETNYSAQVLNNLSLEQLCTRYIDNNIPVVLWATMSMNPPKVGSWWVYDSRRIEWVVPEHCLLLVGYDDNNYIFNDPLRTSAQTYYSKASVEAAYLGLHCQAIVILQNPTNNPFNESNQLLLKIELLPKVENDVGSWEDFLRWNTSEEALDITLSYDSKITSMANLFLMPKALLQTVIFREQRFVYLQDDIADSVIVASYAYDELLNEWENLTLAQQLVTQPPQIPIPYRHDSSTGLAQIRAATAIKAINYAVDQGLIEAERKYNADNLADLKMIWYKLKDDIDFNIKSAALTLIYESRSTLGYTSSFWNLTNEQRAMIFTKYNSLSEFTNDYGRNCAEWYNIFHKYN